MRAKNRRLFTKALFTCTYLTLIYLLILIGNIVATISLGTLFTAIFMCFLYRDFRFKHADSNTKREMLKQMQSDNRKYYKKGRDFADSTRLEYEVEKAEKETSRP